MNDVSKSIGWAQKSWNPITGCLNHTNGLCKGGGFPCYAYGLAHGRLKERYLTNGNYAPMTVADIDNPFYPRFWPERLEEPLKLKTPSKIFVCDMGELFGDWIPDAWTREVLAIVRQCSQHTFQLLTKQPQELPKWEFPENCWVGVTITNNGMLSPALERLRFIEATVRCISFEPLLGGVTGYDGCDLSYLLEDSGIDWLIIGAQTKPYKPPKIEWVQEIVEAADKAGIPIFIKNNLRAYASNLALYPNMKVGDNGYNTVRQEFPKC